MAAPKVYYRKRLATTGEKVRNVLCLLYVDDMRKAGKTYGDLLGYLDSLHIECAVSPVHDRDVFASEDVMDWCTQHIDPETGDLDTKYLDNAPYVGKPKALHAHLLIKHSAQLTAQQYTEMFTGFMYIRPTLWDKCWKVSSSLRYFAHLDSPTKARYNAMDIHGFGGIDMSCLIKRDERSNVSTMCKVQKLIIENDIKYFCELVDYAHIVGDYDLLSYIRGSGAYYNYYLRSKLEREKDLRKKGKKDDAGVEDLLRAIVDEYTKK